MRREEQQIDEAIITPFPVPLSHLDGEGREVKSEEGRGRAEGVLRFGFISTTLLSFDWQ